MGRGPIALKRPSVTLLAVAAATLIADQASKAAVRTYIPIDRPLNITVVPGLVWLTHVRNTGAAFGLMSGARPLFVGTTLAVLAGIAYVWFRRRPSSPTVVVALGLVCGGAIGNLIDRLVSGRVTDFIDVHFWPVFNLADSAVVIGVGILVVWLLFGGHEDGEVQATDRED